MVGMLVCLLSELQLLNSYSWYAYILCMHAFTSEGGSGKCIWSACVTSKPVLINSGEKTVHGLETIERMPLTALASWETQQTSESVFPKGQADSNLIFICRAKSSYSTWAVPSGAKLREIPQDCCMLHKTKQFPKMTWLSVSVSLSRWSLGRTLSFSLIVSHLRAALCWEGCHRSPGSSRCWMPLLETCTHAAHTKGPPTPNIAFPFRLAAAELTDWCTNLVRRCLCCWRQDFHPQ